MPLPLIPLILGGLGIGGKVASKASQGRAQGRAQEAGFGLQQDQAAIQRARLLEEALQSRAGLDLARRNFALQAPGQRGRAALQGDILANAQDAQVMGPISRTGGRMPQITGGLRPSLKSGATRQLGSQMSRNALLSQMQGDRFEPMAAPQIPGATPPPKAGKLDRFLNILGGVGAGAGVVSQFMRPRPGDDASEELGY